MLELSNEEREKIGCTKGNRPLGKGRHGVAHPDTSCAHPAPRRAEVCPPCTERQECATPCRPRAWMSETAQHRSTPFLMPDTRPCRATPMCNSSISEKTPEESEEYPTKGENPIKSDPFNPSISALFCCFAHFLPESLFLFPADLMGFSVFPARFRQFLTFCSIPPVLDFLLGFLPVSWGFREGRKDTFLLISVISVTFRQECRRLSCRFHGVSSRNGEKSRNEHFRQES